MLGLHKRATDKLEAELDEVKNEHNQWLEKQAQETNEWHAERKELNDKIEEMGKNNHDLKKRNADKESKLNDALN